ncbi:MAG: hypothetical protein Q9160_008888, partial [Pyrenula sp. 1 TL-2023]
MQPYKVDDQMVDLVAADPDSSESVRGAMCGNADKAVALDWQWGKNEKQEKTFRDLFQELLTTLEGLQANQKKTTDYAFKMPTDQARQLIGWNYMDLVGRYRDLYPRKKKLKATCGKWPMYGRDIQAVVILGIHFPKVFAPKNSAGFCKACQELPKGKDYLTAK